MPKGDFRYRKENNEVENQVKCRLCIFYTQCHMLCRLPENKPAQEDYMNRALHFVCITHNFRLVNVLKRSSSLF